ncbi:MAG TPA: hypothetical protein VMV86_01785, partial [Methanosarcinales archaeon]|nr:hypothetical protein [Methanosarcinales archaeon]
MAGKTRAPKRKKKGYYALGGVVEGAEKYIAPREEQEKQTAKTIANDLAIGHFNALTGNYAPNESNPFGETSNTSFGRTAGSLNSNIDAVMGLSGSHKFADKLTDKNALDASGRTEKETENFTKVQSAAKPIKNAFTAIYSSRVGGSNGGLLSGILGKKKGDDSVDDKQIPSVLDSDVQTVQNTAPGIIDSEIQQILNKNTDYRASIDPLSTGNKSAKGGIV